MFIIFNLSGMLVTLIGAALGVLAIAFSGRGSVGLVVLALVWIVLGGRRVDRQTGLKKPFPSIFFIPVRFGAVVPLLAAVVFFVAEQAVRAKSNDPRMVLLSADERALRDRAISGDEKMSRELRDHLVSLTKSSKADVESYHIFTREKPDAVLVLVQVPDLSKYAPAAREDLLAFIWGFLVAEDEGDKDFYIGIKGRIAYGAMQTPPDNVRTGKTLDAGPLLAFYGAEGSSGELRQEADAASVMSSHRETSAEALNRRLPRPESWNLATPFEFLLSNEELKGWRDRLHGLTLQSSVAEHRDTITEANQQIAHAVWQELDSISPDFPYPYDRIHPFRAAWVLTSDAHAGIDIDGLSGYFGNDAYEAPLAVDAFAVLGMPIQAESIREAIELWPDDEPLDKYPPPLDSIGRKRLNELEDLFRSDSDPFIARVRFALDHPEYFFAMARSER